MPITKAVRYQRKLRVGIAGPTGAGKTYTTLVLAKFVAEQTGARVGVIDTENFSASTYADEFDFDVNPLTNFSPDDYIRAIDEFEHESSPYVLIVDSLTHAWAGKGGALDTVDKVIATGKDGFFDAWRKVSPAHGRLVDKLLSYPGHLFVTLRVKMAYEIEKDERTGKNKPVKIGLAPVMRDGIEYEFDVFFDMDQDHTLIVTKTRAKALDGFQAQKPGLELARKLWEWSQGNGEAEPERPAQQSSAAAQQNGSAPARSPAEASSEGIDQYGEFRDATGAPNLPGYMAFLKDQTVTGAALGGVVGVPPSTGKIAGWLKRNPTQTLADLTALVIENQREIEAARQKEPAGVT